MYFIRKSKWILTIIILKTITLFMFLILILILIIHFYSKITCTSLPDIFILLYWILLIIIYNVIIIDLSRYFYDIIIINNKSVYHFKFWVLFKEYVFIMDLYRIQEVDSHINGILGVLLNVWDINIIELQDKIITIHFIDNPQKIVHKIRELQYKFVDKKI